ncbi:hypothetical protein PC129_g1767 [Phytophthora cactorum]|uniref:WW domain-containing protein n=3 Tax=Phytophthora TaxID=4783 RepID=A0A329S256_9STRA|nr:hypothetical protein Pcac1_g20217 [Phytophthora cactorum]KAG2806123.1 hypothetical protein PC111_g17507 [Phytophthora cactorum]KAG2861199.1 hypothetical protein PC113_g7390 [Phytophthora cactorum]KAG2917028.1 hypothetical protein PC114_g7283 [Phytophthora cactorum]KAG2938604.1 hypothetical protein PC115_g3668 [Phytophthora cactorum]
MDADSEESVGDASPTLLSINGRNEEDPKDEDQHVITFLDARLEELESRILASAREDESDDAQSDIVSERNKKKREALEKREDAPWVIAELPTQTTTPAYAALEAFQVKKWREILQLMKLMSAPCFRSIRLAGDDRSLYEGFFRAFPHHLVTKARFVSVVRHIFGIPAVSMIHHRRKHKKAQRDQPRGEGHNAEGQEGEKTAARLALDRHLEKMQYCCERSVDNVLVLNWRILLIALRMLQEPLLTMREHLNWAFSVFASSGCLELNDGDTIDADDVTLMFTRMMRNPATSHLVSARVRAAFDMLPSLRATPFSLSSASLSSSRITYRVFKRLLQLPPLRTLVNHRMTPHTSVIDELSVPVYRDFVYRARRREHNRRVLRRLRYFNETKAARLCFHTWARNVRDRTAARSTVMFAYTITTRIKQRTAFGALHRHALASIAALEIQRVFRGMRGRMRAEEAWRKIQAVLAVQGAFRMRAHFTRHLRKLRRQNLFAIRIQRVYRGRLGRIQARQKLLTHYYREMAAIQQEREAFRAFVRGEMARRLQRLFRKIAADKQHAQRAEEEQVKRKFELEMLKLSGDAVQQAARHRREVTERYDKLREEAEYREKRRRIDDIEKQKIVHRRRQREWEAFKAGKIARKETLKLLEKESYERLKSQWENTIAEQTRKREMLVEQLLQLEDVQGEWKKLHARLHQRVKERSKQLIAKHKSSGVVIPKKEIIERAQHEITVEESEEERLKGGNDWLKAEADYLKKLGDEQEERLLAENAEERTARQKSALTIQGAFRLFTARKLLRGMLSEVYIKELDIETQAPRYRNTLTGKIRTQKPTGLGSDELEYERCWVIMIDNVLGEPFFYNPRRMKQSWAKPDDCQFCGPCSSSSSTVFAAVWNSHDDTYLCQKCYKNEYVVRSQQGNLQADAYVKYDGSRPNGQ